VRVDGMIVISMERTGQLMRRRGVGSRMYYTSSRGIAGTEGMETGGWTAHGSKKECRNGSLNG